MIDLMPGFGAFTPTVAASSGPLLDTGIASAAHAYSLRKLRAAYAGSAIRIRRSSDDTEQDIGFTGNNLNTAAITSFVGANSAFVVTWYDQAGTDNLTAFANIYQPRIVNAGTLYTQNSLPAVEWAAAACLYKATTTTLDSVSQMTAAAVAAMNSGTDTFGRLVTLKGSADGGDASNSTSAIMLLRSSTSQTLASYRQGSQRSSIAVTAYDQLFTAISYYDATENVVGLNGTNASSSSYSASSLDATGVDIQIGAEFATSGNGGWRGGICEVVLWASALSSGDRSTVQSNQKTYWGTP